ncbi:MAG: 3-oxoacyl-[acyl-carrier-protein] synthase III C-terminal domain-containing protein [Verrucomicrobiota bacterium]
MFLISLGTASPAHRYSQRECWEAICQSPQFELLREGSREIMRKVLLGNNGITHRHLVLEKLEDAFQLTPDTQHARFSEHAAPLASQAAKTALQRIGIAPESVDALVVSTCTGYLCPGLTSHVSEQLGLRPDIFCLDLVGQGCGAAMPNLRAAEALLAGGGCETVLSVCVEICSAAMYLDDDPGVLISACLFGDGAAAAVLRKHPHESTRRVEWKGADTILSPADRHHLRFEQRSGMLRNILARCVPALAGDFSEKLFKQMLASSGISKSEITGWILHAAGRDVLASLRERLGLEAGDLRWSEGILQEHGNLSSASVLYVLESALNGGAPGGYWWMSSFGAGFSCHGTLLKVT